MARVCREWPMERLRLVGEVKSVLRMPVEEGLW